MRRRREAEDDAAPTAHREVSIPHDPVNEQVVIAAALVDVEARVSLVRRLQPDHFLVEEHKIAWTVVQEMARRRLDYDPATFQTLAAGRIDVGYVSGLAELRPDRPTNLEHHVENVMWDRQRASAVQGPISSMLEALRNPRELPERVRALARQVAGAFDGAGERRYLREPGALIREQMVEVRRRIAGHACFPYGIAGLDEFEDGRRRMLPGAAPGQITVVTGVTGSGKTTFTAHLALGLARQGRRVCYGAWEVGGGMTMEILACIALGWSRTDLLEGRLTPENVGELEAMMGELTKFVTFMENPFRRNRGEKSSNDKNLDLLQGILADAGCEVFIADLWKRCLRDASPEAEEDALLRQQAMLAEMGIHGVLLQQQRAKDIEQRADKRPTREGVKGSGAWVEVADTMFGTYRAAQWKDIADDKFQAIVLKQRYGKWPLAVEFPWDGEYGSIDSGVSIPYVRPGEGVIDDMTCFKKPMSGGGDRRAR